MAITAYNKDVSYPIASGQFFEQYWLPAIRSQNLALLADLDGGLYMEVTAENWQQFSWELQQVVNWAGQNLDAHVAGFIAQRANDLIVALPNLFEDADTRLILS